MAGVLCLGERFLLPRFARAQAEALPEGELSFYNVHTNERLRVRYRDEQGQYDLPALDELNHILRCHHTGEVVTMDPRVIEHINLVKKTLGGDGEIHVISGYRSAKTNAMLAARSGGVAKNSYHVHGMAIDIRLPDLPLRTVQRAALDLARGGVGFYPKSDFVHVDTGPVRRW